jgi:hypothetical protein
LRQPAGRQNHRKNGRSRAIHPALSLSSHNKRMPVKRLFAQMFLAARPRWRATGTYIRVFDAPSARSRASSTRYGASGQREPRLTLVSPALHAAAQRNSFAGASLRRMYREVRRRLFSHYIGRVVGVSVMPRYQRPRDIARRLSQDRPRRSRGDSFRRVTSRCRARPPARRRARCSAVIPKPPT